MKKRIISILMAVIMLMTLMPVPAFAGGSDFAIANGTPESAKETNHGYITIGKAAAPRDGIVMVTVKPEDGYKLKSLTCTPTVSINTIADVLATVERFPEGTGNMKEPPDNAWVVEDGEHFAFVLYSGSTVALIFYSRVDDSATYILLTTQVTAGENCYTVTSGKNTLTFNMTNGILNSITFSSTDEISNGRYGGTYTSSAITPADSETIIPEKQTDGTYQFKMPAYAVTVTAEFEETKTTPYIETPPAPADIICGQKLRDSTLVGGYAQVSSTDSTEVAGLFTWASPDTIPAIADSDVTSYDVTFTPFDTEHYNTTSCQVTITVKHTDIKNGNLEFMIGQGDNIGSDGKSIEYANGCKLSVGYDGIGDNVISTDNGHTELRNIPDGTSVTFTLTLPQGETKVPDLMLSGARESFTDNTFTTNLNFSQNTVAIVSLDFGQQPGPSGNDGHIVKIQINNHDGANGSVQYKFNTEEAFSTKTAADYDGSGNIRLEIPESAATITFKAIPDGDFALQDCTILHDDQDIDETKAYMSDVLGDGYTYTLPDDDKTIVFRADFGNELVSWHTVSWGGGNVQIENGKVEAYAVTIGENTYDESVETADETNKLYPLSDITNVDIQTNPVSFGDTDMFIADTNTEDVSIDFRFIPDYGYQVTDVIATEGSVLDQFDPGTEISTFHFEYKPDTNVHFIVEFTAAEDIIDSDGSDVVSGASIGNGGNAIGSGNLKMTISDVDETSISEGLKDEVGGNEALYLDLALSQVVSKTGSNGDWVNVLTELDGDINVTLNVSDLDPEAQYYVIREHGSSCVTIPVEYNGAEGTVSFDTDKFSTYALVKDSLLSGEFSVEYDNRGDDEAGISASIGDPGIIRHGEQRCFTTGAAITFTLIPPEDRADDAPIVEIQIYDGHDDIPDTVWRSDFDAGNVIAIENNSFSFTPSSDSAFTVRIWWSAYDAFGPAEEQYMIETNIIGGGSVDYSEPGVDGAVYGDGNPHKDCYAVGTDVVLSFIPDAGYELSIVVVGEKAYAAEPEDGASPLSDILDAASGQYQILIAEANEGEWFYVEAVFSELIAPPAPGSTSAPVISVPVSGDENSIKVNATVRGNTATVQPIKSAEIEKVIGSENDTGLVVIDLSGTNRTITGVKLPAETVKAIAEAAAESDNDTAGLKLELSGGDLEFDAKALEIIAAAADGADYVEIHFDEVGTTRLNNVQKSAVAEMDVLEGFEAYIIINGKRVSDFEGGSAAVYIPYEVPADKDPAAYTVWYIAEDGTLEKMNATYDGENHRFVVMHFSDYVLTYDETFGQYDNCPKDDTCPMSKFTDLDLTAWYHDGVHYCLDNGIMAGKGGGKFAPTGTTTRAQIVTILWNMNGTPYVNYAMSFSDVDEEQWYAEAVRWAAAENIVAGYTDGSFKPDAPITREQLAVILYNYAQYKGLDVSVDENTNFLSFNDFWDTSEWAKPAMMWAIERELIVGNNWDLKPQGDATRAQAATIICKFCETVAK